MRNLILSRLPDATDAARPGAELDRRLDCPLAAGRFKFTLPVKWTTENCVSSYRAIQLGGDRRRRPRWHPEETIDTSAGWPPG
jgi:hypothetical protein